MALSSATATSSAPASPSSSSSSPSPSSSSSVSINVDNNNNETSKPQNRRVKIAVLVGLVLLIVAGIAVGVALAVRKPASSDNMSLSDSDLSSSVSDDALDVDIDSNMTAPVKAAIAKASICSALKLYGNAAVAGGLCKTLSTGNLLVCEISGAVGNNPDVHTTFNTNTELHVTVRTLQPKCEGNAYVSGTFPGAFTWKTRTTPAPICNVNAANYLARLNAVPATYTCLNAFNKALADRKINAATQNYYAGLCRSNGC